MLSRNAENRPLKSPDKATLDCEYFEEPYGGVQKLLCTPFYLLFLGLGAIIVWIAWLIPGLAQDRQRRSSPSTATRKPLQPSSRG